MITIEVVRGEITYEVLEKSSLFVEDQKLYSIKGLGVWVPSITQEAGIEAAIKYYNNVEHYNHNGRRIT